MKTKLSDLINNLQQIIEEGEVESPPIDNSFWRYSYKLTRERNENA